jgi:LPS sulfotransferase NodH
MRALNGEVAERPKAHAWKVCIRQRIEGSNPSLTAKYSPKLLIFIECEDVCKLMNLGLEHAKLSLFHLAHRARGAFNNPFKNIPPKPLWRKKLSALPLPAVRYVIFFTPRSGSSRLTDLIERAGGCGIPGEYFNPNLIMQAATSLGAQGLEDYIDLLMRRRNTNGVFGCEVTSIHMYRTFYGDKNFFKLYQPTSSVFLIRENIVEQAVSLSRMAQTGIAHSKSSLTPTKDKIEFHYRPDQIRSSLNRLLSMEKQLERTFRIRNIEPLRLSYETLASVSPDKFIPVIAHHVAATCEQLNGLESEHRKVGDEQSLEYAHRFRSESGSLLETVNSQRAATLSALAQQRARYFPEN